MKKEISYYTEDDNGEEVEVSLSLPAKWEICDYCCGHGSQDHPAFSDGITESEWAEDWDYEDRKNYMNGNYSVSCSECGGSGKVIVVDESLLTKEEMVHYNNWCDCQVAAAEFDYYDRMEREAERRMGC